jgi:DNA-binding MarR family transcriptional regulator
MNVTATDTKTPTPIPTAEPSAFLLARLGKVAARRLNARLAETGLKPPEATILITLRDLGPRSQQDLGEQLHIDASNLVSFLNTLEEDGLVVRRRDPADRRRHIVEITEQGLKRVPVCDNPVDELENELFAGLNDDERERLHRLLTEVMLTLTAQEAADNEDE